MNYKTLIVDGPYLAHRSYSAPYRLSYHGLDATLMHGFIRSLNAIHKKFKRVELLIAWESHGTPSWRREQQPEYKPRRKADNQYINQVKDLQILLHLFGIKQFMAPKNEADDVIGALASNPDNLPAVIFTVDKDIMQMISNNCHLYDGKYKEIFDSSKVKSRYGVYPHQIPDLLAIAGDSADNIQGIDGFGMKRTTALLNQYGIIEKIPNTEPINKHRIKMLFNKRLTLLNKNCLVTPLDFNHNEHTIESILDKYSLKKIKENIEEYKLMGDNNARAIT